MENQLIFIFKKILIFWKKKKGLRNSNLVSAFLHLNGTYSFLIVFAILQTIIFGLQRKTWRIRLPNNSGNLFPPRLFNVYFLTN